MPRPPRELRPHESVRAFFGAELRHWRVARGHSQDDLGQLTLASKDTIGKVEKAIRWPTEQLAQRCDMVLDTGGSLIRLLPLVLAERRTAALDDPRAAATLRRKHLPPPMSGAVGRPDAQRFVVDTLLAAADSPASAPVVVGGPGGFGKSTLAKQVCRDARLDDAFEVVLWAETGPDCTVGRIAAVVADLCDHLTGERPVIPTGEQAGLRLAEALGERRVLLVVDNVWSAADLAPFLLGGPHCVRLITTRNLGVCRSRSKVFSLPPMSEGQITEVIAGAGSLSEPGARRLAELCGGWPLLASVVGAGVGHDVAAGAPEPVAVDRAATSIREDGPQALDVWDADQREGTIGRAVATSIAGLDTSAGVSGGAPLGDCYLDLTIFPPVVPIPLTVLAIWWQRAHGWTLSGVRQFARLLAERSLLGSYLADQDAIVLHDVFRTCLLHRATRPARERHAEFVDAVRRASPGGWSELPLDQPYLWRHLTYHLDQAGCADEVIEVLADSEFVVTKLTRFGPEAMIEDLASLESASSRVSSSAGESVARSLLGATYLAAGTDRVDDIRATLHAGLAWAGELDSAAAQRLRGSAGSMFGVRWVVPDEADGDGHTGAVTCVAAVDELVVSGGEDATVRVWVRSSRRLRKVLRGHHGWVYAVAVSPSAVLASGGDDGTIRLWNPTSGELIGVLPGHEKRIRALTFAASGKYLVSAGEDGRVAVWSIDPSVHVRDMATDGRPMWSVAIGDRDRVIATGGEDDTIRLYDADNGRLLAEQTGHRDWVRTLAFAADSLLLASGSGDGSVGLWNVAGGQLAMLRSTPVGPRIRAVTITSDASLIEAADEDAVVSTITSAGVAESVPMPAGVDWVRALAATGDAATVVGCEDGAVRLLRGGELSDLCAGRDTVWSTAFAADHGIVILGRSDGTIEVAASDTGAVARRYVAGEGRVWDLDSVGAYVVASCGDGLVRASRLDDEGWSVTLNQDGPRSWAVALDPAGRAVVSSSGAGMLRLWELPSGRVRWQREAHAGRVRSVAFDPSGAIVVTGGGDGFVHTWDTRTGNLVAEIRMPAGWVRTVAVDDDGKRVLVGLGSGDVSVHDVTGASPPLHLFGHGGRVLAGSFVGADDVVTAAADGTIRRWSIAQRRQLGLVRVAASLQCAAVDRGTGSVLASSSAGVIALDLPRATKET